MAVRSGLDAVEVGRFRVWRSIRAVIYLAVGKEVWLCGLCERWVSFCFGRRFFFSGILVAFFLLFGECRDFAREKGRSRFREVKGFV